MTQSQATALAELIDVEAEWENLPTAVPTERDAAVAGLRAKQRAFDAYRSKLVAYNRQYSPAHHACGSIGTSVRFSVWCQKVRDILQLASGPYPVSLMAKARSIADRLGIVQNPGPADMTGAAREFGEWCHVQPLNSACAIS